MSDELPEEARRHRDAGRTMTLGGYDIFVTDQGAGDLPVLLLHGFPGSSCDWRAVQARLAAEHCVIAFDFLGHGLSDKPAGASYSLFDQADLATLVAVAHGVERCVVVAHDMGDTVAAELLARQNAGELPFTIERTVLTNGSIFIDMARLSDGQQLLLSLPDETLADPLPRDLLRRSIADSFPPGWADSPEVDALVALVLHDDGDRLLPRLIRYIEERRRHQDRWTAALVDYAGPLTAIWGELDPIAVADMPRRLAVLRAGTELVLWPDVGHWPSIEAPDRLADALLDILSG
ncbi:alpha/beta fold hydrolase [Actinomadura macrotermitis]|uniref:AB hydrolase-1 domain-containing protein n=1 Tax=Actinomadura macrotermitis TaxID=2585200 RepID=A0A7K0BV43_9ACTN|nr:alpha/beta hydrolase [Actinomadura macrotermitis]MQY04936.1 hypothetical protein [Actinomadura macrotermitis]